jgi:hypothetical protein
LKKVFCAKQWDCKFGFVPFTRQGFYGLSVVDDFKGDRHAPARESFVDDKEKYDLIRGKVMTEV